MVAIGEPARITYTNYRGETAERTITPKRVWYGISDWHPEPQWFVTAFDHDKNADRDFALIDFGSANPRPGLEAAALWHEEEVERKRTVSVKSRRLGMQIATHEISAAALRTLSHPATEHADAGRVHEYVQEYEFRADNGGGYTPTDGERAMIEDAIQGFVAGAGKLVEGDDGRPCSMDEFMAALFNEKVDEFDVSEAAASWLHGDWKDALSYLTDVPTHWRSLPTPPAGEVV